MRQCYVAYEYAYIYTYIVCVLLISCVPRVRCVIHILRLYTNTHILTVHAILGGSIYTYMDTTWPWNTLRATPRCPVTWVAPWCYHALVTPSVSHSRFMFCMCARLNLETLRAGSVQGARSLRKTAGPRSRRSSNILPLVGPIR